MRLSLEKKKKKKKKKKKELKLQAAMEGTSHPSTANRWLQKERDGEQYAFKKVNIEEV